MNVVLMDQKIASKLYIKAYAKKSNKLVKMCWLPLKPKNCTLWGQKMSMRHNHIFDKIIGYLK